MKKLNLIFKSILWCFILFAGTNSFAQTQIGDDIDSEAGGDQFGFSVSMNDLGDRVAIGAINNDGNGNSSGHVRVYEKIGSTWSQLANDIDGETVNDQSGYSVSLSADGNRVAIGAPFNDDSGNNSGQVRVYELSAGAWTQVGADIDGESVDETSGYSVSLSADGNKVAIGAPFNDDNATGSGQVRIYEFNTGVWSQLGSDIDGEATFDQSGLSLDLSSDGNTVAIGSINNGGGGSGSGHVRVYRFTAGVWTQLGADIDGVASGDQAGASVSLNADGSIVAVGSIRNDDNGSNSGHVRVFELNAGTWVQLGSNIVGEAAGNQSGHSVSLDASGSILAIGAPFSNDNGTTSGQVRVYYFAAGVWTQLGSDIDGEAAGDALGFATSMNSDGTLLAIGSSFNSDNGNAVFASGHVRVFEFPLIGLEENSMNGSITLFPNPSIDGKFSVQSNALVHGEVLIQIINIHGQQVFKKTLKIENNGVLNVNTSKLSAGVYFVKLQQNQNSLVHKLIIE